MTTFYAAHREQFHAFLTTFRTLASKRDIQPADHIAFNIVRDLPLDRGFTPLTNAAKLANGQCSNSGFVAAKAELQWALKRNPIRYGEAAPLLAAAFQQRSAEV